jgi:hypothetical protein
MIFMFVQAKTIGVIFGKLIAGRGASRLWKESLSYVGTFAMAYHEVYGGCCCQWCSGGSWDGAAAIPQPRADCADESYGGF